LVFLCTDRDFDARQGKPAVTIATTLKASSDSDARY